MRIAYLGPEGTFSHEALRAALNGDPVDELPRPTLHATVLAVQEGEAERALVPIENSIEGAVNATLDALALDAPDLQIVGETVLGVLHCLLARTDLPLSEIAAVVSHPHVPGQCARFLQAELPGARIVAAGSSAEAVREVVASSEPWAAIGTRTAAERYGAVVLREGIEDDEDNATRFVWLARDGGGADPAGDRVAADKTSVLFLGSGDGTPGWLVRCLSEFAFRGVNLTKIESRPQRGRLGHYLFHVDCDGSADDPAVAAAIHGLEAHCERVRVLGSYAAAR